MVLKTHHKYSINNERFININHTQKTFNFLKSLNIASIKDESRNKFREFLAKWGKKKKKQHILKRVLSRYKVVNNTKAEDKEIEVGFVDGLFEMYKLRAEIRKAR